MNVHSHISAIERRHASRPHMNAQLPHIDARGAMILDSIKAVFAAKGFDGASMQDLARAAGMSAGNFYRYFRSKDAIIAGIVARDLDQVRAEFNQIINSPDPSESFRKLIRLRIEALDSNHDEIFAEISAAAARRPEIAAIKTQFETEVLGYLTAVFGRIAGLPTGAASQRFRAHGSMIMLLIQGLSLRNCGVAPNTPPAADRDLAELVLSTIERMLADIATHPSQPLLPTESQT